MTVLEALAILQAATLECKKINVNTPEVSEALDSLERYIRPEWLIPQFRYHALEDLTDNHVDREGQQQVLRATFQVSVTQSACCLKYEWMRWLGSSMRHTT